MSVQFEVGVRPGVSDYVTEETITFSKNQNLFIMNNILTEDFHLSKDYLLCQNLYIQQMSFFEKYQLNNVII